VGSAIIRKQAVKLAMAVLPVIAARFGFVVTDLLIIQMVTLIDTRMPPSSTKSGEKVFPPLGETWDNMAFSTAQVLLLFSFSCHVAIAANLFVDCHLSMYLCSC
jgi:hypothetical protein